MHLQPQIQIPNAFPGVAKVLLSNLYTSLHQISKADNRCLEHAVLTYILWMNKRLHRRHYNENRYLLIWEADTQWRGRGAAAFPPQVFDWSDNRISTKGQIMPSTSLLAYQIFRPSYGPVWEADTQCQSEPQSIFNKTIIGRTSPILSAVTSLRPALNWRIFWMCRKGNKKLNNSGKLLLKSVE